MFCQTTFSSMPKREKLDLSVTLSLFFSSVAFDFVLGGVWCACSIFTVGIAITTFYISCRHLFRKKSFFVFV